MTLLPLFSREDVDVIITYRFIGTDLSLEGWKE